MANAKYSFMDILNAKSKSALSNAEVKDYTEIYLNPNDVIASDSNFYSQSDIEELADSFLAVGQQQPTVLARINGEYRIVSGHRRNLANKLLLEKGYKEYEKVRYLYKDMTEATLELSLIIGNAYNRELTAYEKTIQAERLKKALIRAKEEDGLEVKGRMRDIIADLLNESATNIQRMEQINNNLCDEAKEEFKSGTLGITAAYETSKLPEDEQKEIVENVKSGSNIRAKEIAKKVAETIADKAKEKVEQARKNEEDTKEKAEQMICEAEEKKVAAEIELREANELKMYVKITEDELERVRQAAEKNLTIISNTKVSEMDTKEKWTTEEWARYTLNSLLTRVANITYENVQRLQEILIDTKTE